LNTEAGSVWKGCGINKQTKTTNSIQHTNQADCNIPSSKAFKAENY